MRILPSTWQVSLHRLLSQLRSKLDGSPRIAIVGVGNPFRCDDAVGLRIVHGLSGRDWALDRDRVLIVDAGHAPENSTREVRKFCPDLIVFVDAAEMGSQPGTVAWIPEEDIEGMSASTHSLPLSMLARYLRLELGCQVALLGIQPASNEVEERMSAPVLQALNDVVKGVDESMQRFVSSNCPA